MKLLKIPTLLTILLTTSQISTQVVLVPIGSTILKKRYSGY